MEILLKLGTHLLYARSNDDGYLFNPSLYASMARLKNLVAFAASPARHLPAACSNSSAASRKSFSDCGSCGFAFDFGFGFRKFFDFGGISSGVLWFGMYEEEERKK